MQILDAYFINVAVLTWISPILIRVSAVGRGIWVKVVTDFRSAAVKIRSSSLHHGFPFQMNGMRNEIRF